MRKKTLKGVCFVLSVIIVSVLNSLVRSQGIHLPPLGYALIYALIPIVTVLLLFLLTVLNRYLLTLRKMLGRDIEQEERHESEETSLISIKPR